MQTKSFRRLINNIIAIVLAACLLSGCVSVVTGGETPLPEITGGLSPEGGYTAADDVFSLNYDSDFTLNPMTTGDSDNILITQLMYDNVYEVDSSFEAASRVIASSETQDGLSWYFNVDESVKFWDGSTLSALDVAYSIQRAMLAPRFSKRLASVWGVSAQTATRVAVTLNAPNMLFPMLLTIPVIKNESIGEHAPLGTGAFMPDSGFTKLTLFSEHPDASIMPISTVMLKRFDEVEDQILAFENSELDLVVNDPTSLTNLGYGSANDSRYYPTTNLHYLGFNSQSAFFSSAEVRHAMTFAINRESIVSEAMGGAASAAAMPISPASALYNSSYAELISYSVSKSRDAFEGAGVKDLDSDGKREFMYGENQMEIDLDFIVCSDSPQKVAAARIITESLTNLGITVQLRELLWNEYNFALSQGEFDMYYAETMMTADFNPGQLVLEDGALNYGGFENLVMEQRIKSFLAATDETRGREVDLLTKYLTDTAPIVAVCFERHQVITHRNIISNMRPSQFNIFQNIQEWIVDLGTA
ncbi:MAG: ABC transporter substrate-binding protein [Oscillospiraceae bacterium]|jgi:peptide/nickel transport system substrate-binding protein|nr:ABC transporter substrate-binding protein [Oscillospiraceae bacterium]